MRELPPHRASLLVVWGGVEPPTSSLSDSCSNQLSYQTIVKGLAVGLAGHQCFTVALQRAGYSRLPLLVARVGLEPTIPYV